ncbi:MAG: penicillin acylase family protein [Actinomycetota bacterium]
MIRVSGRAGLLAATAVLTVTTSAIAQDADVDGRYGEFGDAGGFWAVSATNQLEMWSALEQSPDDIAPAALSEYFDDASFGVAAEDIDRTDTPHPDVTVIRDERAGVAHIMGQTRYATMYAQGYTTAQDRLFTIDALRHLGRGRLSELIGLGAGEALDRALLATAPYTEDDLRFQYEQLRATAAGTAIAEDLRAYADGINGFLADGREDPSLLPDQYAGRPPEDWVPEDAGAIANAVVAAFGRGGGRELSHHCRVAQRSIVTADPAGTQAIFATLTLRDDVDATTITSEAAPYPAETATLDVNATPTIDCASVRVATDVAPALDVLHTGASVAPPVAAALLATRDETTSGRPVAVLGTDAPYGVAELLVEKDVHGPGIDARGVGIAGIDLYVFAGRGDTYAFSATPSGADNVDMVVLRLCDPQGAPASPDANRYEHNGRCVPFDTWTHELRAPDGAREWSLARAPDYGPVLYRARLPDGTAVAIAEQRSTYGRELNSLLGLRELNDPAFMRDGFTAFRDAAGSHVDLGLDWFYIDARDIGYQHSCRCPVRAPAADPMRPAWGTGAWDWIGFLERDAQPFARNPESGVLAGWGNRPAPQWTPADDQTSWGVVQRRDLLADAIETRRGDRELDVTDLVEIVRAAANTDVRGPALLPRLLQRMQEPPADIDPRAFDARERLEIWADEGPWRADRDGDGAYDDAVAPALLDAWWPRLADAIFGVGVLDELGIALHSRGFGAGAYSQVWRALEPGGACGGDDPGVCEELLWSALAAAVMDLEAEFATSTVAQWQRQRHDDVVVASAVALQEVPLLRNRAPFEQVIELATTRDRRAVRVPTAGGRDDESDRPPWLLAAGVVAVGALVVFGVQVRRRRRH